MQLTDKHFIDWFSEVFSHGYGTGEQYTVPALHQFFITLKDKRFYESTQLEELLGGLGAWMLIGSLCQWSILSYGSSPRSGWIDYRPECEALRDYVLSHTPDQLYELVTNHDDNYIHCYSHFCNCDVPCGNPLLGHTTETPSYREINKRAKSLTAPALPAVGNVGTAGSTNQLSRD